MGLLSALGLLGAAELARAADTGSNADLGGAAAVASAAGVDVAAGRDGGIAPTGVWANLWSTREQQAQRLLDSKRPAEAAPLFGDARRRAYAELQAGQYDKAAEHLAPFKDADSEYNRGNALAHTGKLQDALAAYDAALARSPDNGDVMRNRELVARALKDQSRGDPKSNGANSKNGGKGGGQGQSNGGQGDQGANSTAGQKQDNANPDGRSQSGGQQQSANQGQPGNQGQAGNRGQTGDQRQTGDQPQPANQNQTGSQAQAGNQNQAQNQAHAGNQGQPGNQGQSGNQPQPGSQGPSGSQPQPGSQGQSGTQAQAGSNTRAPNQTNPGSGAQPNSQSTAAGNPSTARNQSQDDLSEAARLAERAKNTDPATAQAQAQSLAEAGQRGGANVHDSGITANKARASADAPPEQPRSEQALALDQWLRGIPEDSGELLRRKFLIEHMMKQQGYPP